LENLGSLSYPEQLVVNEALNGQSLAEKVIDRGDAVFTRRELQYLQPSVWLDDKCISAYLRLLREKVTSTQSIQVADPLMYGKLTGHTAVGKWRLDPCAELLQRVNAKQQKEHRMFDADTILWPIHIFLDDDIAHWALGVIHLKERRFEFLDSSSTTAARHLEALRAWFFAAYFQVKGEQLDPKEWSDAVPRVPQQHNGYDCGVFVCKFAECIFKGVLLEDGRRRRPFHQGQMAHARQRICLSLVTGQVP